MSRWGAAEEQTAPTFPPPAIAATGAASSATAGQPPVTTIPRKINTIPEEVEIDDDDDDDVIMTEEPGSWDVWAQMASLETTAGKGEDEEVTKDDSNTEGPADGLDGKSEDAVAAGNSDIKDTTADNVITLSEDEDREYNKTGATATTDAEDTLQQRTTPGSDAPLTDGAHPQDTTTENIDDQPTNADDALDTMDGVPAAEEEDEFPSSQVEEEEAAMDATEHEGEQPSDGCESSIKDVQDNDINQEESSQLDTLPEQDQDQENSVLEEETAATNEVGFGAGIGSGHDIDPAEEDQQQSRSEEEHEEMSSACINDDDISGNVLKAEGTGGDSGVLADDGSNFPDEENISGGDLSRGNGDEPSDENVTKRGDLADQTSCLVGDVTLDYEYSLNQESSMADEDDDDTPEQQEDSTTAAAAEEEEVVESNGSKSVVSKEHEAEKEGQQVNGCDDDDLEGSDDTAAACADEGTADDDAPAIRRSARARR